MERKDTPMNDFLDRLFVPIFGAACFLTFGIFIMKKLNDIEEALDQPMVVHLTLVPTDLPEAPEVTTIEVPVTETPTPAPAA